MDTHQPAHQPKDAAARPADEELKKHGDQLERQVREAAGKPPRDRRGGQGEEETND